MTSAGRAAAKGEGGAVLIPGPDTRVVELRVHGSNGTTPEALTGAVAAVDVAGDGVGRIVRPADRLRRPAPGAMLQAAGRPVSRIVEGYVWGRMTSGGWVKATWALLFPFSLSNLAAWMLPPLPEERWAPRMLAAVLRALLRLAALLLTMLLVAQATVVTLDLLATQCLAPGSGCLSHLVPEAARRMAVLRAVLGLAPVALLAYVLHRVSAVDWALTPARRDPPPPARRMPLLPGAGIVVDPDTPMLRSLHTAAALGTASLLALGGPLRPTGAGVSPLWTAAAALLVLTMLGAVLLDNPTGAVPHRAVPHRAMPERARGWPHTVVARRALITVAAFLLAATAVLGDPLPRRLPGSNATVGAVAVAFGLACVATGVLLAVAALVARRTWADLPRDLRPWAGGWMAAPVLATAGLLGCGFGAGLAITVDNALGSARLEIPAGYELVTLLWGAGAVLCAAATAVLVPSALLVRWFAERLGTFVPPMVRLLHPARPQEATRAARAWWWAELGRRHLHHTLLVLAGVLAAGTALSVVLRMRAIPLPNWAEPLSAAGVVTLASLAAVLLHAVYAAARRPDTARRLGVLADIASFWPREAHPTVPPCYGLKVVPEVADRAAEHLAEPGTRVVLVGHSQGSLLATLAAARLLESIPEADRERVGLVTTGTQLQWAYPRAFPSVVAHSSLAELAGQLRGRWRALCRGTDPLGGAATTWHRQVFGDVLLGVGFRDDGTVGALPPATSTPTGALVLGGDHWLPDPQAGPLPGRRWSPGVLGHSDYLSDPEWDRAIAIAAGLEPVAPGPPVAKSGQEKDSPTLNLRGRQQPDQSAAN